MTTLAEDSAALTAAVAEVTEDKNALVTKAQHVCEMAEALCNRIVAERPDMAPAVQPQMDQLKATMAQLAGQLQ